LRHTENGVVKRFIDDLQQSIQCVKKNPKEETGMAPVYGMTANLPLRGILDDILVEYLDMYYHVDE